MNGLEFLLQKVSSLEEELQRQRVVHRWGVVTSLAPLKVRLDGETSDTAMASARVIPRVGTRVEVKLAGKRATLVAEASAQYVQYNTSGGVNGTYIETGASDSTSEPSFRLRRQRSNGNSYARFYISNNSTTPEIGIYVADVASGDYATFYMRPSGYAAINGQNNILRPLPFATAAGYVATGGTANTVLSHTVTFPSGRFTSSPEIFVLPNSSVPNAISVSYGGRSANGFTLYTYRTNTTAYNVSWFAIQMEP